MTDKSDVSESEASTTSECALCLEPLDDCTWITNPWMCRHHFHNTCVKEYVTYNSKKAGVDRLKCPICDDDEHVINIVQSTHCVSGSTNVPDDNREYLVRRVATMDRCLALRTAIGTAVMSCFRSKKAM